MSLITLVALAAIVASLSLLLSSIVVAAVERRQRERWRREL